MYSFQLECFQIHCPPECRQKLVFKGQKTGSVLIIVCNRGQFGCKTVESMIRIAKLYFIALLIKHLLLPDSVISSSLLWLTLHAGRRNALLKLSGKQDGEQNHRRDRNHSQTHDGILLCSHVIGNVVKGYV